MMYCKTLIFSITEFWQYSLLRQMLLKYVCQCLIYSTFTFTQSVKGLSKMEYLLSVINVFLPFH